LCEKRTSVREFDKSRLNLGGFYHPDAQRPGSFHTKGACLLAEDPKLFDHEFFGIHNTQVVLSMDPSQRKMLEVSYEAFENAGESWEQISGSKTGVFVGNMTSDHSLMQAYDADFSLPYASTGGSNSILSNRINHIFNLRGPRYIVVVSLLDLILTCC
jgi:acyl transferase domain-containing protein